MQEHDRYKRLSAEPLEARHLLAASPVITEFMASNGDALRDGDGNTPDWIEVLNPGDQAADLAGYRLTDRPDQPSRWVFPSVQLDPGERLVVFASGQDTDDYVDAAGNLHTNFALGAGGEYLALIAQDGSILSQFGDDRTDYPPQRQDVSYGVAQRVTLVDGSSGSHFQVPLSDRLGIDWTQTDFDAVAAGFLAGRAAIGFESRPQDRDNFASEIQTPLPPRTHAVYLRTEFTIHDADAVVDLLLRVKYDNALVVYLNGAKVAEANAPSDPQWFTPAPDGSRRDSEALEFADFDLSDSRSQLVDGNNVLAFHLMGNLQDDSDMLLVPHLVAGVSNMATAVGRAAKTGYMASPTPGAPNVSNSEVVSELVADTRFSVDRGFFDQPLQVEITSQTPGAEIRVTTDGSQPTAATGELYTGPISISTTTTLRAAAFKADALPTNVDSHSYVFLDDVIRQPARIEGIPSSIDLEMDPDVVDDPRYSDEIIDSLLAVPTLSITLASDNFFGARTGIYTNPRQRGAEWERAASIEMLRNDGVDGFQEDGGIRIFGNGSRGQLKKTFRLVFRGAYGAKKLRYPLFPDSPVEKFDNLILRPQNAHSWRSTRQIDRLQTDYMEDAFARDAAAAMGKFDGHAAFVNLYINGLYWGLYTVVERPDAGFAEEYLGGDDEDYDAINRRPLQYGGNGTEAIDGDLEAWRQMIAQARTDLSEPTNYAAIQQYVDPESLIQQFLIHQYMAHNDGPEMFLHNNMRLVRRREPGATFHPFVWDMERSFVDLKQRINISVDVPDTLSEVYTAMQANPEFRMLYADLAHKYLLNDGALTAEASTARYLNRVAQIESAIVAESARWGDNQPNPVTPGRPFTRDIEWQAEIDRMVNDYFPQRPSVLISQLRSVGLYPKIDAPRLDQHGGAIASGFQLSIRNSGDGGTILYTLDGVDPRQIGDAVSPAARLYDGHRLALNADTNVKARILLDGQWSALTEADFYVEGPGSPFHLRVTELNYHPHEANLVPDLGEFDADRRLFQFIEVMNTSTHTVDLTGVHFTQSVEYVFPDGMRLEPSQRVVVVSHAQAFRSRYGVGPFVAGEFARGVLSESGGLVELRDPLGRRIQSFRFDDQEGWPSRADGLGSSLEIVDPTADARDPANWRDSLAFGGSPASELIDNLAAVVVSEALAQPVVGLSDLVELHNMSAHPVDIGGWYMSNSGADYFQFRVPASTVLPAHGYAVFTEAELGFGLNGAQGDDLWLIQAEPDGQPLAFVDHVWFGPTGKGVSVGRWPQLPGELLPLTAPTFGSANQELLVGDVTMSEVHYAPLDPDGDRRRFRANDFEFIELYNRSDRTVDLTGWRLAGGVEYQFPAGTGIDPQRSLVVVPFDSSDASLSAIFRVMLDADAATMLLGPYSGDLDDAGDEVLLQRKDPASIDVVGSAPYLTVDETEYGTQAPWPADIVGTGDSLHRAASNDLGRLADSWRAGLATPGSTSFFVRTPGDANGDGSFDQLDLVVVLQAGKYQSLEFADWHEGDWNGDGLFDRLDIVAALHAGE